MRAGDVAMRDQQLRMLTLAQRGQQTILSRPRGADQPNQFFRALKDPLSLTPDVFDMDVLAAAVREHQIGTFAFGDDAAVMQAQRLRRDVC